jgi:hypothetical protein
MSSVFFPEFSGDGVAKEGAARSCSEWRQREGNEGMKRTARPQAPAAPAHEAKQQLTSLRFFFFFFAKKKKFNKLFVAPKKAQ